MHIVSMANSTSHSRSIWLSSKSLKISSMINSIFMLTLWESSHWISTWSALWLMASLLLTHIARFISWEDSVRAHPAYIKAALAASKVCSYPWPVPFLMWSVDLDCRSRQSIAGDTWNGCLLVFCILFIPIFMPRTISRAVRCCEKGEKESQKSGFEGGCQWSRKKRWTSSCSFLSSAHVFTRPTKFERRQRTRASRQRRRSRRNKVPLIFRSTRNGC